MLTTSYIRIPDLRIFEIMRMHAIFEAYYENGPIQVFIDDLSRKDGVFLVRRKSDDVVVGFSTLAICRFEHEGRQVQGLFSGDTVIEKEYWGSRTLQSAFARKLLLEALKRPLSKQYWLLISKGYKTYLLMARNLPLYYPDRQAVRDQASVLLGGLQPVKVFATGHSQSAMRLTTYANAIQPLDKVYDGIMIHGRANTGTKLASSDNTPSNVVIRNDLSVPVFQLQSEMDVAFQSGTSKAMDTAKVRYWKVAGAAHADEYLLDQIYSVSGREIGFYPPSCLKPANRMPFYAAQNAAYHHLTQWALQGIAPPTAPRIQRDWLGFIKKDRDGNALGGLRLPDIDVPVAQYGYANFTTGSLTFLDLFSCIAGGSTEPFSAYKLGKLYPTKADYVSKYEAAAAAARAAGYVLAPDQATLVQKARQAQIPK